MHYLRNVDGRRNDGAGRADEGAEATGPAGCADFLTVDDLDRLQLCAPEIAETLEALACVGQGAQTDPSLESADLLAMVKGLEAVGRCLEFVQAQAVARLDREINLSEYGARRLTGLLRTRLKVSLFEARRRESLARNLVDTVGLTGQDVPARFPHLATGLEEGRLSADQIKAAIAEIEDLPLPLRTRYEAQVEETLADTIGPLEVVDVKAIGARIRAHLDPDGDYDKDPCRPEELHVTVTQQRDGSWRLRGKVDGPTGLLLSNLLTNREKGPKEILDDVDVLADGSSRSGAEWSETRKEAAGGETACGAFGTGTVTNGTVTNGAVTMPAGANAVGADGRSARVGMTDCRPDGARRHDRFALLIKRAAQAAPAGAAYALVVTASAEEYARGKGEVQAAGGHVRLDDVLKLSPGGTFYFQANKPGTKQVQVRSEGRFATRRQVELITARDKGCTFPGCDMPAGWCEAHHMVPHSKGGPTDVANLTLACSWHHHWHDQYGWRAEMVDALPAWVPPTYIDTEQIPLFHSRFLAQRAAITGVLPPPGPDDDGEYPPF